MPMARVRHSIIGHGKLEICGLTDERIVLGRPHARSGHACQASRMPMMPLGDQDGWMAPMSGSL
jgi:hypothetical protein